MSNTKNNSEIPWHKQFWPWFLIALPATVIVASIGTMIVAFRTADSLVQEDYYREGLAVNDYLAFDKKAHELKLRAKISLDSENGEVRVSLNNETVRNKTLLLELLHAKNKNEDIHLTLQKTPQGDWLSNLPHALIGQWYIRLSDGTQPADDRDNEKNPTTNSTANSPSWRLQTSVFLGAADKSSSSTETIIIESK